MASSTEEAIREEARFPTKERTFCPSDRCTRKHLKGSSPRSSLYETMCRHIATAGGGSASTVLPSASGTGLGEDAFQIVLDGVFGQVEPFREDVAIGSGE